MFVKENWKTLNKSHCKEVSLQCVLKVDLGKDLFTTNIREITARGSHENAGGNQLDMHKLHSAV